jgi:hypothetical protein
MEATETIAAYYRSPAVRARIREHYGDARGLAGYGGRRQLRQADGGPVPAAGLGELLDEGADVCRGLEDGGGTLVQLDVDYTNPDDPAEPYRSPDLCFARLEPVHREVTEAFAALGLRPQCLLTGRGYHFTFRAPWDSPLHRDLLAVGRMGQPLRARYAARPARDRDPLRAGLAHDGAGRMLEHLAHGVMRRLRGRTEIPVTLADVPVPGGGAFVCLDLTAYADPLSARYTRCAFSANQKARALGPAAVAPFVVVLPREAGALPDLLEAREDVTRAARLAQEPGTAIPDFPEAPAWRRAYEQGPLGWFHREFDRGPHLEPADWPYTYDRFDLQSLPACARLPLEHPNPWLLVPLYLRTVALALWGIGWHPRSVAALVASRYGKDLGWQGLWDRYEPCARAEFYVRLFCGLAVCGVEDAESFTCRSQAARGGCPDTGCGHELGRLFEALTDAAGGAA